MRDKKAPLFCRIRKHIVMASPSATFCCRLGLKYRPEKLCKGCPENVNRMFKIAIEQSIKEGLL